MFQNHTLCFEDKIIRDNYFLVILLVQKNVKHSRCFLVMNVQLSGFFLNV